MLGAPSLSFRCVSLRYRAGVQGCMAEARALERVSFIVERGERVAICGPPGSGKRSLLKCAAGMERPGEGEIRWRGSQSSSGQVAYVSDRPRDAWLTVDESIEMACATGSIWTVEDRVAALRERAGLAGQGTRQLTALSQGQRLRLRVACAMVGVAGGALLVAEASSEAPSRFDALPLLMELGKSFDATLLSVAASSGAAQRLGMRVLLLDQGHLTGDLPGTTTNLPTSTTLRPLHPPQRVRVDPSMAVL